MSNTSLGKGKKGSKYWMDVCVETPALKEAIDKALRDNLTWKSPLCSEKYREYELKQREDILGLSRNELKEKFSFWPSRQPQWDGIAVGNHGKRLYIFEAKAHLSELKSNCQASPQSELLIDKSMREVHDKYYSNADFSKWKHGYYQMANRLVFLHKLKDMELVDYTEIKLVFLNFVGDETYISTGLNDWKAHMKAVFRAMTGNEEPPEDVYSIYIDVGDFCN